MPVKRVTNHTDSSVGVQQSITAVKLKLPKNVTQRKLLYIEKLPVQHGT